MPISPFDDYVDEDAGYDQDKPDPGFWIMLARIEAEHDYFESCGGW